jgi:hypothetical protein
MIQSASACAMNLPLRVLLVLMTTDEETWRAMLKMGPGPIDTEIWIELMFGSDACLPEVRISLQ